jgi:hypothetical protein
MNYRKVYIKIIKYAKSKNRQKLYYKHPNYVEYEEHHILPKALFPLWKNLREYPNNAVLLTPREHFFCHQLLTKIYGKRMIVALWRYSNSNKHLISSREYERLRLEFLKVNREFNFGNMHLANWQKINIHGNLGKNWFTDGTYNKLCYKCPEGWRKGKTPIKKHWYNDGKINIFSSIPLNGWFKGKLSKINNSDKMKGRKYFNNGIKTKFCYECPEGFKPGRLKSEKFEESIQNLNSNKKGKKFFNNGQKNIMADKCPEGFKPGRI